MQTVLLVLHLGIIYPLTTQCAKTLYRPRPHRIKSRGRVLILPLLSSVTPLMPWTYLLLNKCEIPFLVLTFTSEIHSTLRGKQGRRGRNALLRVNICLLRVSAINYFTYLESRDASGGMYISTCATHFFLFCSFRCFSKALGYTLEFPDFSADAKELFTNFTRNPLQSLCRRTVCYFIQT